MIKKLENQTSRSLAKLIDKEIVIEGRIKCENEEIYYNVDILHTAIIENKKVKFQYFDYDINKKRILRHDGMEYIVSPYSLSWIDDKYYLVGQGTRYNYLSNYRVDKICNVIIKDELRQEFSEIDSSKNYFNIADYSKKMYHVFSGVMDNVEIRFKNHLAHTVIDKFGLSVSIIKDGDENFLIRPEVIISDGFISWLFMFGDNAEVISPFSLRMQIRDRINRIQNVYE